jgi:hypothetical protein
MLSIANLIVNARCVATTADMGHLSVRAPCFKYVHFAYNYAYPRVYIPKIYIPNSYIPKIYIPKIHIPRIHITNIYIPEIRI